jgi:DNA-binding Lrp family transcriptional regulator
MRVLASFRVPLRPIAQRYGLAVTTAGRIVRRLSRRHVA